MSSILETNDNTGKGEGKGKPVDDIKHWYIAIGGYNGSLYHMMPTWTNYFFKGTEKEVKVMFAKLYSDNYNDSNEEKVSFKDLYVSEKEYGDYGENELDDDEAVVVDEDDIFKYLDSFHFDTCARNYEYNMGYKLLDDMDEDDWCAEYIDKTGTWIDFDSEYTFDTIVAKLVS